MHQRTPYSDRRGGAAMLLSAIIKPLKFGLSSHSSTTAFDVSAAVKTAEPTLTCLLKLV
jgi:hypothetical protein